MGDTDSSLAIKCLAFCQSLTNQGMEINFSLTISSTFSFSFDTRQKPPFALATKKKASPSTLRRNARPDYGNIMMFMFILLGMFFLLFLLCFSLCLCFSFWWEYNAVAFMQFLFALNSQSTKYTNALLAEYFKQWICRAVLFFVVILYGNEWFMT